MLELTPVMTQKLILKIVDHPYAQSKLPLIETLSGIIYDYIRTEHSLEPDWYRFCSYCQVETPDNQIKLQTASACPDESEQYPYLWALRVKARDALNKRRNWTTHIGLRLENEHAATLYFAELYYDHIVGSFNLIKQPTIQNPVFLENLLASSRVLCLSGTQPLPHQAIPLDGNTLDDFTTLLFDTERFLPVVVVTCPDLISPRELAEATKGNLVVFWLDDYSALTAVNNRLPPELNIEWDSTRVFLPFESDARFHPAFSASDITRAGGRQLIDALRLAYCVGMRAEDRRAFVTVDTIMSLRDQRASALAHTRLASNAAELVRLREDNVRLTATCEQLTSKIKASSNRDHQTEIAEYETLLSESMKEVDQMKLGVTSISERLYADMGKSFKPNDNEPSAQLCELQHAIYACLARFSNR